MPKIMGTNNEFRSKKLISGSSKRKFNKSSQQQRHDKIKFPMKFKSPYVCYSLSNQNQVMKELGNVNDAAKQLAQMWRNLTTKEISTWETRSSEDKSRYETDKYIYEVEKRSSFTKKEKENYSSPAVDPPTPHMTAFMYYSIEMRHIVIEKYPQMNELDIAMVIREMWKNISEKDREYFHKVEQKASVSYMEDVKDWQMNMNNNTKQLYTETFANDNDKTAAGKINRKKDSKESDEPSFDYTIESNNQYASEKRSHDSDHSSSEDSTSDHEDLNSETGKSRPKYPPCFLYNPSVAIDKDNFVDLARGSSDAVIRDFSSTAANLKDLNNMRRITSNASAPEFHRYGIADLTGAGTANYISAAAAAAAGISTPSLNYLPHLGATQAYANIAGAAPTGSTGIVTVNPSHTIQPNQVYSHHPGLFSSSPPTTTAVRTTTALPLQQLHLMHAHLNVRRQLQSQFPAYFMDGRRQT